MEYRNLCVRKVELLLVRNFADNTRDEFTVRISAHAQRIIRQSDRTLSEQETVTPFEEYWTFGRLDGRWKLKEVLPPGQGKKSGWPGKRGRRQQPRTTPMVLPATPRPLRRWCPKEEHFLLQLFLLDPLMGLIYTLLIRC